MFVTYCSAQLHWWLINKTPQVTLIVDKLETLQLTISALDKRLATIDRGLDKLMLVDKKEKIGEKQSIEQYTF